MDTEALNDLYLISGIPFWIVDRNGTEKASFPHEIAGLYRPSAFSFISMEIERLSIKNDLLVYYFDDSYYSVICNLDDQSFLVTALMTSLPRAESPATLMRRFVNEDSIHRFTHYILSLPGKMDFVCTRFAALAKKIICGSGSSIGEPLIYNASQAVPITEFSEIEDYSAHIDALYDDHKTYVSYEQNIITAVSDGDSEEFLRAYYRPTDNVIGKMSSDSLRQQKYQFICMAYALSRAAISGGMSSEQAFRISDEFCMTMDNMRDRHAIEKLGIRMALLYCEKVSEVRDRPQHSQLIKECSSYIKTHLYQPLYVSDIASAVHVNRKTLSLRFLTEIGQTIPEFITDKKLEEAGHLLLSTSVSIREVSELLCFSSQSYFTKLFKAKYGLTPKAFMESNDH